MKFVIGAVLDIACGRFQVAFFCDPFKVGDAVDNIGDFKFLAHDGLR